MLFSGWFFLFVSKCVVVFDFPRLLGLFSGWCALVCLLRARFPGWFGFGFIVWFNCLFAYVDFVVVCLLD